MLYDLLSVWFPRCCYGCGMVLPKKLLWLCFRCAAQLPRSYTERNLNNPLKNLLDNHLPTKAAYAPFYFQQQNPIQHLLHALKYLGKKQIGAWFAAQAASFLPKNHPIYSCDAIVPVPLHPKRERQRGYNQIDLFGKHWAAHLEVPYVHDFLVREKQTKTLVRMAQTARWQEVKDAFGLVGNKQYRHVLLLDDVITTGATLTACGQTLLAGGAKKLSVMAMAHTYKILP